MNKLKFTLPQNILININNSLIISHINYFILLWGSENNRVSKLQKRAVRIIRKESRLSHTDTILKEMNLLKINDIYRLQLLKCYFKYEHNSLPKYFDVFNLRLNSEIHARNTRNQHKLGMHFVKHNFVKACVRYQLPKTVNSMPRSITEQVHTHSFNGFSTYVKLIFLDTYTTDCNITNCMQYQFELVNSALWGQTAGSAYLYSRQMLPFGFARQNQILFFQLYFI